MRLSVSNIVAAIGIMLITVLPFGAAQADGRYGMHARDGNFKFRNVDYRGGYYGHRGQWQRHGRRHKPWFGNRHRHFHGPRYNRRPFPPRWRRHGYYLPPRNRVWGYGGGTPYGFNAGYNGFPGGYIGFWGGY